MPNDFNQQVIEEFRANAGEVGGYFEGARLILLTTTGARSGERHTTPVSYYPDGGASVLVIASAAGAPQHPDWFHNLLAHPQVTVETGVFTYEARAEALAGAERDKTFARLVEAEPGWADYQAKTTRVIPVVALHEIPVDGPPNVNASSMGQGLKVIHDAFRRELALLRKEFTTAGPTLGAQLRVNCLTLCAGLHNHHTGEELGIFPFLAEQSPRTRPGPGPPARGARAHRRPDRGVEADHRRRLRGSPARPPGGRTPHHRAGDPSDVRGGAVDPRTRRTTDGAVPLVRPT
jgi:deazaflavin-dependent oxidoreductase (nitroreductase family)